MTDPDLTRLRKEAEALAAAGPGTDVALRSASPEEARMQLQKTREEVERQQRAIQAEVVRRKREIEAQHEKLKNELAAQMAEMNAALEPLQKMMGQLKEGIWTVNLYLGTSEQILTLREGKPAPIDTPISIRQLVLAMDEECAVAAEEGGIDSINIEEFDEWLLADPAHVDQVLPERKGVVALVPRWGMKKYDDPWMTEQAARGNKQTYFLIRNGEQLYRIWTDFNVGRKLLPTRDEYADIFWHSRRDWDTHEEVREAIRPGTRAWEQAEEKAAARERHYMRVAMIFEGLIHRTTVWHPVLDGVSFLDPAAHRSGSVVFIMDGEEDRLIGTGREPWNEWLMRLNSQLRPGMRIILSRSGVHNKGYYLSGGRGWYNPRLHPDRAKDPPGGELLTLEDSNGRMVVKYKRTEEIYDPNLWVESETRPGWGHRGGYKVPTRRASCVIKRTDEWVLPYDLATEEELRAYLTARLDRHEYVTMFPVIKSALVAKRREREEEEPFVVMLSGVLARENGGMVADAMDRIPDLIRWYKLANRHHRALKEDDAKAVRLIVAEDARRLKAAKKSDGLLPTLRGQHPDAIFIGRRRGDGKYLVFEAEDDRNVFVHRFEYGARKGLVSEQGWWKPEPHVVNRLTVLYSTERWENWDLGAKAVDHLTGPERDQCVDRIVAWARDHRCDGCRGKGVIVTEHWGAGAKSPKRTETPCEKCDGSGRESLTPLAVTPKGRRDREAFTLWVPDPRDDDLKGARITWRRDSEGITLDLYRPSFSYSSNWKDGHWIALGDAMWVDQARVDACEADEMHRREQQDLDHQRYYEESPYVHQIEDQRKARAKTEHVAAFVRRYEHEELYEGHMKAHPEEAYEHERLDGLRAAIRVALDRGEDLAGLPLGVIWTDAPEEDRHLCFALPDEEDEAEPQLLEDEWQTDGDFIEGEIVEEGPLGLPSGD